VAVLGEAREEVLEEVQEEVLADLQDPREAHRGHLGQDLRAVRDLLEVQGLQDLAPPELADEEDHQVRALQARLELERRAVVVVLVQE